jgi:hypothetical protein
LIVGCGEQIATVRPPKPLSEEHLLQVHRKLALDQQIEIEAFIHRKGWTNDMKRTESGLYILIWKDTVNAAKTPNTPNVPNASNVPNVPLKYGDTVVLQLNIKLLNGTEIFCSTQKNMTQKYNAQSDVDMAQNTQKDAVRKDIDGVQNIRKDAVQKIIVGKTEMTAGLREALSKMHYGENAFFIVPPHLAYGFSGDGDNIPAHAALLYELKIKTNK